MAKEIITSIQINANKAAVWEVLTDFEKYPEWNPFIKSLSGNVAVGNQIRADLGTMVFNPKVLEFNKETEFRWLGKLWFKGLFDGEHYFKLSEGDKGAVIFEHGEKFNGLLVPLFAKSIDGEIKAGFEAMNRKLRERAESSVSGTA